MSQNPHYSRYCLNIKSPCIPPKFSKLPAFWQITQNSPTIFHFNNEKWNPQISQRTARKSLNSPPPSNESREICIILVKSYQSLLSICTPTFLQQISQNSLNSQILRANDAKLINFALISTNLLF